MTPLEIGLATLFALWWGVSVATQIPKCRSFIQRRDILNLAPAWNFFAPTPGQGDYHLLYRDRDSAGEITDWHEISDADSRPWWTFAWNPGKRPRKALFDVAQACALISRATDADLLPCTFPYLVLLNHVSALPREDDALATQFLIMYSHGTVSDREPEPVMISNLHDLD